MAKKLLVVALVTLMVITGLALPQGSAQAWPKDSELNCQEVFAAIQNDSEISLQWNGRVYAGNPERTMFSGSGFVDFGEWAEARWTPYQGIREHVRAYIELVDGDGNVVDSNTIEGNLECGDPPPPPPPPCIVTDLKGNLFYSGNHLSGNPVQGQVTNLSQDPNCQSLLWLHAFGSDLEPESAGWLESQQHVGTWQISVPPGTVDAPLSQQIDTSQYCWYQVDLVRVSEVRIPPYYNGTDMVDYVFVPGTKPGCEPTEPPPPPPPPPKPSAAFVCLVIVSNPMPEPLYVQIMENNTWSEWNGYAIQSQKTNGWEISIHGHPGEGRYNGQFRIVGGNGAQTLELQVAPGNCTLPEPEVEAQAATAPPCPTCPADEECLLEPGAYVQVHNHWVGLTSDGNPVVFETEQQALDSGLEWGGTECGLCAKYLVNMTDQTVWIAAGSTEDDIARALNAAEGSPAPNYLNRHMEAAHRAMVEFYREFRLTGQTSGWYSYAAPASEVEQEVPAPQPTECRTVATDGANLNVRVTPDGTVIGTVGPNATLTVIGHSADGNWMQIQFGETTGWVASWLTQPC